MDALLFRHADIASTLQALFLLEDLRAGFLAHARGQTEAEAGSPGAAASSAGVLPQVPAYSVRMDPGPQALEGRASVLLRDAGDGQLMAVLEAPHITRITQAVVGALAADVLSRPDAARVALLGAQADAAVQLKSLRLVRSLKNLRVWDEDPFAAVNLAARLYHELQLPSQGALTVQEAVGDADIILCIGPTSAPLLTPDLVHPGVHINALGAEVPGGGPLSGELLAASRFVVDERRLALQSGVAAGGGVGEGAIDAELGEVLAGTRPGRLTPQDVTVFAGVGLPFQDLVAAWQVYQALQGDEAVSRLPLEA